MKTQKIVQRLSGSFTKSLKAIEVIRVIEVRKVPFNWEKASESKRDIKTSTYPTREHQHQNNSLQWETEFFFQHSFLKRTVILVHCARPG